MNIVGILYGIHVHILCTYCIAFALVMSFLVASVLRLFLNELLTAVVISWQPDVTLRYANVLGYVLEAISKSSL